jgi:hypothetical protein
MEGFYNTLVSNFKTNKNKVEIVRLMIEYCRDATPEDIYNLKVKMETEFALDVDCKYCYFGSTPSDYGCDLREILFERDELQIEGGKLTEGGETLLNIFREKKLPDMWHIMTDVDDTLYPNTEHGTYIAGSDISWDQKHPYPGIISFYNKFYECFI